MSMTQTSKPQQNQRIRLTETAPVSAQFIGCVGTVTQVLGNAILIDIEGHGGAFVHLGWGTKKNPGELGFEVL
jgi:hypothetical protein